MLKGSTRCKVIVFGARLLPDLFDHQVLVQKLALNVESLFVCAVDSKPQGLIESERFG